MSKAGIREYFREKYLGEIDYMLEVGGLSECDKGRTGKDVVIEGRFLE